MTSLDDNWDKINNILYRKEKIISPVFNFLTIIYNFVQQLKYATRIRKLQKIAKTLESIEALIIILVKSLQLIIKIIIDLSRVFLLCLICGLLILVYKKMFDSYMLASLATIATGLITSVYLESNKKMIEQLYWNVLATSTKFTRLFRLLIGKKYIQLQNLDEKLWNVWQNTTSTCVCEQPLKAKRVLTKLKRQLVVTNALYESNYRNFQQIIDEATLYLELLNY